MCAQLVLTLCSLCWCFSFHQQGLAWTLYLHPCSQFPMYLAVAVLPSTNQHIRNMHTHEFSHILYIFLLWNTVNNLCYCTIIAVDCESTSCDFLGSVVVPAEEDVCCPPVDAVGVRTHTGQEGDSLLETDATHGMVHNDLYTFNVPYLIISYLDNQLMNCFII